MSEKKQPVRLGGAGAGVVGYDMAKVEEGVEFTVPSGPAEGLRVRVRPQMIESQRHERFLEDWAQGHFAEAIDKGKDADLTPDKLTRDTRTMMASAEYVAHVLVADLPDGVAIPDQVDDLATLPEAVHEHYKKNGSGFALKAKAKDVVEYTPEVGAWVFAQDRYADVVRWIRNFAHREKVFREEQLEREGNS